MNNILEAITDFISSLSDKVSSFYEENKKLSYIILSLLVVILICMILLAATTSKEKSKKKNVVPGTHLELTEKLIIPNGPELPRDYNTSRKTKEKWTEEEAEPWFTIPSEKEIDSLANANENMINEIIGAAP